MNPRNASRVIGVLILVQMIGSGLVNFVLEAPLFGSPGFLVAAAPHALQIGAAALLGIGIGALGVGIAVSAYPVFRQHSQAMALWFFALAVAGFAVHAVENMNVMSMLSLSETYANAGAAARDQFEGLRGIVASSRNWAHFITLITGGCTLFVMYATLYRFTLVPRLIAGFGLVAVPLQITTVARPLFGLNVIFPLLAPLGICQLILAIWLIAKGFRVEAPRASA
jgi:hypothetical protein